MHLLTFYKEAILSFFRRCLYIQDFQHILPLKYEALSKLNKFTPQLNTFPLIPEQKSLPFDLIRINFCCAQRNLLSFEFRETEFEGTTIYIVLNRKDSQFVRCSAI